jgi:hypothetical protein
MSCPVGKEWNEFIDSLNEANDKLTAIDARVAYSIFNKDKDTEEIPSVPEALDILNNLTLVEKDEEFSRLNDESKQEKFIEQLEMLDMLKLSSYSNEDQRKTLDKLMNMTETHIQFFDEGRINSTSTKTISVSKLIGSTDFKGDPNEYIAFKLFGTFIHDLIEKTQKEAIEQGNISINKVFDKDFFIEKLNEFKENEPFEIEGLTDEMLFVQASELVNQIASLRASGHLIIPEISIVGTDLYGTRIVGRVDMLLIDPKGSVKIYDFKTKKVKLLDANPDTDWNRDVAPEALAWLAVKTHDMVADTRGGTQPNFVSGQMSRRSAYDTWAFQVNVYKNLLEQNGLDVSGSSILALLYETDANKNFLGSMMHEFLEENYYIYGDNDAVMSNGVSIIKKRKLDQRIPLIKQLVNKFVPGKEKVVEEKAKATKLINEIIQPTEDDYAKMRTNLKTLIETELQDINRLHYNKSTPVAIKKITEQKRETLLQYKEILNKISNEDLDRSINFANILDKLYVELSFLNEKAKELEEKLLKDPTKITQVDISKMTLIFNNSQGLTDIINVMERVLNEARDNKENLLTETSPAVTTLGDIKLFKSNISHIKSLIFRKTAATKVLMAPGKKAFERINVQLKELLTKEVEVLEREIEQLKDGRGLTFTQRLKSQVLMKMSKEYKKGIDEKLDATNNSNDAAKLTLIEEKEKRIKICNDILNGRYNYDEASVLAYLDSITDPNDTTVYVGSDRVLPYNQIISSLTTANWVATVSNKDLATASVPIYLKNVAALAVKNAQNDFASSNFDELREKLYRSGRSFEKINDLISEKRVLKYTDPDTGEIIEKTYSALVAPYSQEYVDKYFSFRQIQTGYKKQLTRLKAERQTLFENKKSITDINAEIKQVTIDKNNALKKYNKWLIENCSLPFTAEFYEVQQELPVEIAEKLQDLYLELENIRYFGEGFDNFESPDQDPTDMIEDYEFDRISEIEDEIRQLRLEAREIDPKYDEFIKRMDDFYEFDINRNYYTRQKNLALSKFEGNPEAMQKWLDENEITKPKVEWYDELSFLYEELAGIFGEDQYVKDIMEKRSRILRKHKGPGGVLITRFMSDADVEEYDNLTNNLDEYLASKEKFELSELEIENIQEITGKISALKEVVVNPNYQKDFDMRYEKIVSTDEMIKNYESRIAAMESQGIDQVEIDKLRFEQEKLEIQFSRIEQEFRQWYNKNHTNTYKSYATGYKIKSFAQPKKFNMITRPATAVADKYMETVPHPKYTKKRMKQDAYFVNGEKLDDEQRDELKNDPLVLEELLVTGQLVIEKGVYNPDYLESSDGIPMPKNIIQLSDNIYIPANNANLENINPKYLELYKDKDLFDFYNAISTMYFKLQKQVDGKSLGYIIPGNISEFSETLYKEGLVKAITKQKDLYIDKNLKAYGSAQDLNDNIFGESTSIRLKGNKQLDELYQSKDVVSSIMKWSAEAHYNVAMQEAQPIVDAFISELKSKAAELQEKIQKGDKSVIRDVDGKVISSIDYQKRLQEINKVIELSEYERNKFVSGKYEDSYVTSKAVTKRLSNFFRYTSFIRIGFDLTNQSKNYVAGSIQALLAAAENENAHYSKRDFIWAKAHVLGKVIPTYLGDLGKISSVRDETMLYRLFNPTQKEFDKYLRDLSGKVSRKVINKLTNVSEAAYFFQDKGDTIIGMTVLWAVMNNYKYRVITGVDANGENIYQKDAEGNEVFVSAHECYERDPKGTNQLVIRSDVEYTQDDENFLRNIVYSEMKRAQGNYSKADQVKAESTSMGKMVLFFKKYLIPMFSNRFGYMKTNWEAGEVALGYWRAVGMAWRQFGGAQTAKHLLLGGKTMSRLNQNTIGSFMTNKINHARRDAMMMMLLTGLSMMALAHLKKKHVGDDEDDDKELGVIEGNLIRLLWSVKGETNSMFPVGEGSSEYIKNFTTAIPFVREFTAASKTLHHAWSLGAVNIANNGMEPDPDVDSEFYQDAWKNAYYNRKAGSYEKGDAKIVKDFVDLTGIKNFRDLLDPNYRIDILKRNQ